MNSRSTGEEAGNWLAAWRMILGQSRRLLDRLAGRAALEHPVISDHRVEALVPHHVGGLELPGRPVFPARILDPSVGDDTDRVHAERRGLLGLGSRGGRARVGDDQDIGLLREWRQALGQAKW